MLNWKSIRQAIKHQKRLLVLTTMGLLGIGAYLIYSLPYMYVSSARILVERRGLFSETDTITAAAQDTLSRRMHAITTTVLSTNSIASILVENDLAPPNLGSEELALAVEDFRDRTVLELDNVAVVNQFTGKSGMYSQGMIVEFADTDPDAAFAVAQTLTRRVLSANKGKGEADVEYRRTFLTQQFESATAKLAAATDAVARFKNENALFLPEVHPLTIRRYEDIEAQSSRIAENISRLRRDLNDVRAELGTSSADAFVLAADGTRILGADEQLRLLEAEYARALSRYTENHPEVAKLRSELDGLRRYAQGTDKTGLEADLQQVRQQLSAATTRYGDDHPDVKALRRQVTLLQNLLDGESTNNAPTTPSNSSNPAYNRMLIREKGIIDDIARDTQMQIALRGELERIKEQLARMPQVEQQLATLLQKQEAATLTYEEIESELEQLSLSFGMREADLLDRFLLIEPPRRPYAPSRPAKKLLLVILGLLAVCAGLLAAIAMHAYRDLILDSDDVEDLVDLPVYMIPKFQ